MRGLINRLFHGWKRTRVPQSVWDAYSESGPTSGNGQTMKERLATMPTDHIVTFMADYHRAQGSSAIFLTFLKDDLNANRGEITLL